jgi:hypothetical protein
MRQKRQRHSLPLAWLAGFVRVLLESEGKRARCLQALRRAPLASGPTVDCRVRCSLASGPYHEQELCWGSVQWSCLAVRAGSKLAQQHGSLPTCLIPSGVRKGPASAELWLIFSGSTITRPTAGCNLYTRSHIELSPLCHVDKSCYSLSSSRVILPYWTGNVIQLDDVHIECILQL